MPGTTGLSAYKQAIGTTISGRELEAAIFTKAANLLKGCLAHWDEKDNFRRLGEALTYNQRIWTIFQDELTKADNPLPIKIRENILTLSVFVDRRIVDVMAHPEPEKLAILIDINRNLAAGLRGSPAQ
jgi:flagellar protein FlaF